MSILDLPTEILELVIRDLDPLSLVSLYQSHSDVADRIDTTTGIWERVCRRYTPAEPLKAVVGQHLNGQFCFTSDKWKMICLKLAKPSLYVSQTTKPIRRLWRLRDQIEEDKKRQGSSDWSPFQISNISTFDGSTIVDVIDGFNRLTMEPNSTKFLRLDLTHSYRGEIDRNKIEASYPGLEEEASLEFIFKRRGSSTQPDYDETELPVWKNKFKSEVSCIYRYGNLLLVGTPSGRLKLYAVEPDIPDSNDILTTSHPFATVHEKHVTLDDPKESSSSVLNWKTELLFVARTYCKDGIETIDVIDREKVFSVVCTDCQTVCRIDFPSDWDTQSGFLLKVLKSSITKQ